MSDKPLNPSASSPEAHGSAEKPPKKELRIDSPPEEQLAALQSAARSANSDLTQLICRDEAGKLISVAVFARAEYAPRLERFLKRIDREED